MGGAVGRLWEKPSKETPLALPSTAALGMELSYEVQGRGNKRQHQMTAFFLMEGAIEVRTSHGMDHYFCSFY